MSKKGLLHVSNSFKKLVVILKDFMLGEILFWSIVVISSIFTFFWIMIYVYYDDVHFSKRVSLRLFPSVTIAVPAYNEGKNIYKALSSLKKLDYPLEKKEIIVIDDGSVDNTYEQIKMFSKQNKDIKLKVIRNHTNEGKAKSLNKALKKSTGEFFVVMDGDTRIRKNALLSMLKLYYANYKYRKIGSIISHIKVEKQKTLIEKFQRFEYIHAQFMRNLMSRIGVLYITPGAFSLYKKEVLEKIGGFDESTLTEDFEIALRLKLHGYEILFDKGAVCYTDIPSTFVDYLFQRLRWNLGFIENTSKYFFKFLKRGELSLFGHIFYPVSLFSLIILLLYILINFYRSLEGLIDKAQIYYYANTFYLFDITSFHDLILTANYKLYLPLTFLILASVVIYFLAFRHGREKIRNTLSFIVYFVFYSITTLLIWFFSIFYYFAVYKKKKIKRW